jgi:hypothetical protein
MRINNYSSGLSAYNKLKNYYSNEKPEKVDANDLEEKIKKAAIEDAKKGVYLSQKSEHLTSTYTRVGAIKKKNMILNNPSLISRLMSNQFCFYDAFNNHVASWNNMQNEWSFIATDKESAQDTHNYGVYREAWKKAQAEIQGGDVDIKG